MGLQHIVDGCLSITQVNGRKGKPPAQLVIPIHPELQAELDLMPSGEMQFLTTPYGKPFSAAGFTSWFVEQAQACARIVASHRRPKTAAPPLARCPIIDRLARSRQLARVHRTHLGR